MAMYVSDKTVLLLHGNGADGSTSFHDEMGKVVTANGGAKISTAQSKFGGSSMSFYGAADSLAIPGSTDFDFGVGDLTIEAWVYLLQDSLPDVNGSKGASICNTWRGSSIYGWNFQILGDATTTGTGVALDSWSGVNATLSRASTSLTKNQWFHFAASLENGVRRLFINGVQLSVTTTLISAGSNSVDSYEANLMIGKTSNVNYPLSINGYIDDLRIVKGLALYTSNFTPPTAPLEIVAPIQIQIQAQDDGITKLAKYDPSRTKPVMQEVADDLQDRMPYGLWQTPAVIHEFKGRGVISGTVKVFGSPDNVPLGRLVRLHREPDGMFVRATWSDPITGAYTFNGVRLDCKYSVTSFDYHHGYRAVIADNLSATPL